MTDKSKIRARSGWRRLGLLVFGSLLFAAYLARLDWAAVGSSWMYFPGAVAAGVILLNLFTGALKYGRWSMLLRTRSITARGRPFEEYMAINAGFFLGLVTPGTSGELARGAFSDVAGSRAVAIVGFEKICDFGILLLMVAGSAVVQFTSGLTSWLVSALIAIITLGAYLTFLRFDRFVTAPLSWLLGKIGSERHVEAARGVYWEFYELLKDRRSLVYSAGFSFLLWSLPVVQMHMILNGLDNGVPLKTSAFVFLFPYLVGILSMIPAGIGAFDIAAHQLGGRAISLAGATGEIGSFAPLYFRLLVTVPLIVLGYASQLWLNARKKSAVS